MVTHPHQPPNSEKFALKKPFFAQNTYIILAEAPPKLVFEQETAHGISNLRLKYDRK